MSAFIICLMGPTASGKTQLAIDLLNELPCEIVSVDSALVYKELNIGSAKPSAPVLSVAPHHLINLCSITEIYSVANFIKDVHETIAAIFKRGKIPLLVGGTMMYFNALQKGLSEMPSTDQTLRARLLEKAAELGWPALHRDLTALDPVAALRIHPNDTQRTLRALEVYYQSGKNLTGWHHASQPKASPYQFINFAITCEDRARLHERIALRFREMLAQGLVDETKQLLQLANADCPALRSVGYRQVIQYLQGIYDYDEMVLRAIIASRQLAKRQLTWLRHWSQPLHWLESTSMGTVAQVLATLAKVENNMG